MTAADNYNDSAVRMSRLAALSTRIAQVAAHVSHLEDELDTHTESMRGDFYVSGYYKYADKQWSLDFVVTFGGNDGCDLSGAGHDAFGSFTITGRRTDATSIAFAKRYAFHTVQYDGVLTNTCSNLTGTWTIDDNSSDAFELRIERVDPLEHPMDIAVWHGSYSQFNQEFSMSFVLRIYASGRFAGSGDDSCGAFTIAGAFLNGSHCGPFVFTKAYSDYAITYRGERRGSSMNGEYESDYCGCNAFHVERKHLHA